MANFCRECGSKLVNGKCVRLGCPNYGGPVEQKTDVKMEPGAYGGQSDPDKGPFGYDDSSEPDEEPYDPSGSGSYGSAGGNADSGSGGFSGPYSPKSNVSSSGFGGFGGSDSGASGYGSDSGASGYGSDSGASGYGSGSGASGYGSGSGTSGYGGYGGYGSYGGNNQGASGYGSGSGASGYGGYGGYSGNNQGTSGYDGNDQGTSGYGSGSGASGYGSYGGYGGNNQGASGYGGYGGNDQGTSGYGGYNGNDQETPDYGGYGGNNAGQSGSSAADEIQRTVAIAGKNANQALKGGMNKINQGYENYKKRERAITEGTGQGMTLIGDETITGIKLVSGETMVRTYHCTTYGYIFKKEGYITVTNKRVIFEACNDTSRISNEVVLDGVTGFRNFYGTNINILLMICGVLFVIMGFTTLSGIRYGGGGVLFLALLMFALAAVMGFFSIRRNVVISVFSSKSMGTPILIGEGPKTMVGNGALYTMVGRPTEDTNTMIREIGAMVQDLQTRGDHAIKDWSLRTESDTPEDSSDAPIEY